MKTTLRITLMLLLAVFFRYGYAQAQTISGKVTDFSDNQALPGVNVVVEGTTTGTVTDIDGNYSLEAPENGTLVFSFIGYETHREEINNRSVIDVALMSDIQQLSEVVVTALGIEREERSLGYSLEEVSGEELTQAQAGETNVVNTLNGKVAGVQISGNTGTPGGSSRILIRGVNSIAGDNQPLFVVDGVPMDNSSYERTLSGVARGAQGYDYGNAMQDINPNDIESISVLKGASAAALYGTRASNGVILITTKSGRRGEAIGVDISSGVTVQTPLILPDFQNEYGGGSGPFSQNAEGQNVPLYSYDQSWGPRLDGRPARQWYSYYPGPYEGQETPWVAHPDNFENFLETGGTWNNNVGFSGGGENTTFRLSYNNIKTKGIFPNSDFQRNNLSFSGSLDLTDRLTASTSINYVNNDSEGRPEQGYGAIMVQYYHFGQRQVSDDRLRDYVTPAGQQKSWNRISATNPRPIYADNPYWIRNMNTNEDSRDRVFGNFTLSYELADWLNVTGRVMNDSYTDRREERVAVGSREQSEYYEAVRQFRETNADVIVTADLDLTEDFSLNAFVGGNHRYTLFHENIGTTVGGLAVAGFYSLENSTDRPDIEDYTSERMINSVFGSVTLGFRDIVYLDATLRNDWSSTLPEDDNSFLYPSVSGTFIFSELLADGGILNFGKLRASWAQVGADTDPYRLVNYYTANTPFAGTPSYSYFNQLNNADLKPERTNSWEVGAELQFLENRIGLDLSYYESRSFDQIFPVAVTGASGFTTQVINAGEMTNKGVEVLLRGTPVATADFTWNVDVNWSRNRNEVVELTDEINNYQISIDLFGNLSVNAREGEPYGTLEGYNYVYDDNGEKMIDPETGNFVFSDAPEVLGSVMPDWRGGIRNSFNYKGVNLAFLIDGSFGSEMHSTTNLFGKYSGMMEETVEGNIRQLGVIAEGVLPDGQPNDMVLNPATFFGGHFGLGAAHVYDASYVKLREVSLGYSLPQSLIGDTPFQSVNISLVGRNLALLYSKIPHLDPEVVTNAGNTQGFEGGNLPSLRSYGVNVKLSF